MVRVLALVGFTLFPFGLATVVGAVDYSKLIQSAHCEHADSNLFLPCSIVDLTAGNKSKADSEMTIYSSAIHPDVIYVPGGWNGHKYWMSYSPYPHLVTGMGNENPHVACSDDGVHWKIQVGPKRYDDIPNPLDTRNRSRHFSYLSDPDLLLDSDSTLWLIYRGRIGTDNDTIYLLARSTRDGIHWSEPSTLVSGESQPDLLHPEGGLSPSIVRIDSTYHLWYVDGRSEPSVIRHLRSPHILSGWTARDSCLLKERPAGNSDIWHIDVLVTPDSTLTGLFTFTDSATTGRHCRLAIAASIDKGETWSVCPNWLLTKSSHKGAWDSDQIYRAGGYWDIERGQPVLKLYYSATRQSKVPIWGTGLTTVHFNKE